LHNFSTSSKKQAGRKTPKGGITALTFGISGDTVPITNVKMARRVS
jgi:hypothetical protein